jgi:hypothetical protein
MGVPSFCIILDVESTCLDDSFRGSPFLEISEMTLKNFKNKTPIRQFAGTFSPVWNHVAGGKSCTEG